MIAFLSLTKTGSSLALQAYFQPMAHNPRVSLFSPATPK
jgi:hypothetical protein